MRCAVQAEDDVSEIGLLFAGWRVGKDDRAVSGVTGREAGSFWMVVDAEAEEDQEKVGTWAVVVEGSTVDWAAFPRTRRSKSSSAVEVRVDPVKPFVVLEEVLRERVSGDLLVADSS